MSRTRSTIVADAHRRLKDFAVLGELCTELGKIDDLDNALAKKQAQYDEVLAKIATLESLDAKIQRRTEQLAEIEKRLAKARQQAETIIGTKGKK